MKLTPFGPENPEPMFSLKNVKISDIRLIGKDKNHLKLIIERPENTPIEAIGFGLGDYYEKIAYENNYDLVISIKKDDWGGKLKLVLRIKDLRQSS